MALRNTLTPSGALASFRKYIYDADDRLVSVEDSRRGRLGYDYDRCGNLLNVVDGRGRRIESYTYDPAGNQTESTAFGQARFGRGNRIERAGSATYEFDADGNLIRRADDRGQWTFEWDRDDQLARVLLNGAEVARYEYDLTNRRTSKTTAAGTTKFLYDGYTLRAEVLPNGTVRHYVSLPGLAVPIARWGTEGWFFFSYDQIGVAYEMFDEAGVIIASTQSLAFGNLERLERTHSGIVDWPFAFMGQYRDAETGLHYNHFRYYDPLLGRFISQDPMGIAMGTNFYAYPQNPNNYADLVGFGPVFECMPSWTPCQKAYARQKIASINSAPASRRVKTCTKCRANAQRRDFKSKRCGSNKIGRGRQIDHMHELQAGGADRCCKNLRAIPKKFNNQLGKQVKKMLKGLAEGETIKKISTKGCRSKEPCKPEDSARLAQAPKVQEAKCTEPPLDDNC